MKDAILFEKIDAYLLNDLSQKERAIFEMAMQHNKALKEEVLFRKEMLGGLNTYRNQVFKEKLKNVHQEVLEENKHRQKVTRLIWLRTIAASVLLLIGFFLISKSNTNRKGEQLFAAYFSTHEMAFQTRNAGEEEKSPTIEELYNMKKFAQALPMMEYYLKYNLDNPQFLLGMGISYLKTNKLDQAEAIFSKPTLLTNPFFVDRATWYMALINLRRSDLQASRVLLQQLASNEDADLHEQAKELLKKLAD